MLGLRLGQVAVVVLAATGLVMPAPSLAQKIVAPCRLCSSSTTNQLNAPAATPLHLEVESRLDFDKIVFGGNGTAQVALSPDGTARLSGAAAAAGARAMPGTVLVRGEPGRAVRIDLPRTVTLFGESNGAIRIESLATDLPAFPRIGDDGTLSFRFGGDLRLTGDSDGAYHGTIDIMVDYL